MTGHRISGSKTDLARLCLYWARPDVTIPPSSVGAAAHLGSASHEVIEVTGEEEDDIDDGTVEDAFRDATTGLGIAAALGTAAEKWKLGSAARQQLADIFDAWAEWWPEWRGDAKYEHEVPMAWDCKAWASRELPSSHQRDYSQITPSEIPLTIDAVSVDLEERTATVIDWKTGLLKQKRADECAQLATAALCVSRLYDVDSVRVVLVRIRPGWVGVDEAWLDEFALDAHALSLEAQLDGVPSAEPMPGPHCSGEFCPALSVCEGPRALARRAPELARSLPVVVDSEERAAAWLGCAKPIQAWLDEGKRAARAWAELHGRAVRMPDGSTMRLVPESRRSINVDRAEGALRARFGDVAVDKEIIKVTRKISVAAVAKLAQAGAPRGKKGEAAKQLIEELRATGGVKDSVFDVWEVQKSSGQLPE